ncbi:MAG: GNAT family N-acetyltransferase [Thermoplasmata archaeon]|nr:GNAT family N-acetyltransferase [Thermoplasmata archaeon]
MIRELKKTDATRVFELLKIGFPEEEALIGTNPEGFAKVVRRLFRWDTQFVIRLLRLFGRPIYRFFVVEEDGKVVATTLLSFPERSGYVSTVVVDPAYRRRGLAQALLERARAVTQATGRRYIVLDVLSQNAAARTLYERIGYRPLREGALFVRDANAPLTGGPSTAIRPFRPRDARPLVEVARRSTPPEVLEVLPVAEGALRGSSFVDRVLESASAAWVVDHGQGPEGHLSATATRASNSGHVSSPIIGEGVSAPEAIALVRTAIDWCVAQGAPRIATRLPASNVRGRAALLEGGFHEALTDQTLYRPVA